VEESKIAIGINSIMAVASMELERIALALHRRAHRQLPLRCARVAARSPTSGASVAAMADAKRSRHSIRLAAWSATRPRALHTAVLIATFGRDTPARCGAFVDERRIIAGEGGAAYIIPRRAVGRRRACASLVASFAAGVPVCDFWQPSSHGVFIATFRCAAPARGGAFAVERRVVSAAKAGGSGRETVIQFPG